MAETSASPSVDTDERLTSEIWKMLKTVPSVPEDNGPCIFKTPRILRHGKEAAYTPKIVSIGPLHHGEENLEIMEAYKKRHLSSCLRRFPDIALYGCVTKLRRLEASVRGNYSEDQFSHEFSSDQFVTMMLLDGFFIIELFLLLWEGKQSHSARVFLVESNYEDVYWDLLLLENQLPFPLLEHLFSLVNSYTSISFFDLFVDYFGDEITETFHLDSTSRCRYKNPKHFLDYFVNCYSPSPTYPPDRSESPGNRPNYHFIRCLLKCCLPSSRPPQPQDGNRRSLSLPSATEIHKSGVRIKKATSGCFLDLPTFAKGELVIPTVRIEDPTEGWLRNLVAMEQCHTGSTYHITDYIFLMDYLINTPGDAAFLRSCGIIDSFLGSDEQVCGLFNDMGIGVGRDITSTEFRYHQLFMEVSTYCSARRNRWKARLRKVYLNNPWTIISLIAAAVLLICTVIQTICALISVS